MSLLKSLPAALTAPLRLIVLPAALAALTAAPAQAREARFAKVMAELNDPQRQDAMADALEALGTALLDVKVAPFLQAMDRAGMPAPRGAVDPDATLADVAGPGARAMPHELAGKLPMMMGMMGTMAGEMETMLPQLEAMGRRLERTIDNAARREARRGD